MKTKTIEEIVKPLKDVEIIEEELILSTEDGGTNPPAGDRPINP